MKTLLRLPRLAAVLAVAGLGLAANHARAQLAWSVYNDNTAALVTSYNGKSYPSGAAAAVVGGDIASGTTVSFVIPPATQYDFVASNFAPFLVGTTTGNAVQASFHISLGGLVNGQSSGYLFSFGFLDDLSTATPFSGGNSSITQSYATLTDNGILEIYKAGNGYPSAWSSKAASSAGIYSGSLGEHGGTGTTVTAYSGNGKSAANYLTAVAVGSDVFQGLVQFSATAPASGGFVTMAGGTSGSVPATGLTVGTTSTGNPGWVAGSPNALLMTTVSGGLTSSTMTASNSQSADSTSVPAQGTPATCNAFVLGIANTTASSVTVTLSNVAINYETGAGLTTASAPGTAGITTVNPIGPPAISTQPSSPGGVNAGQNVTLTVAAYNNPDSSTGSLSYQWYFTPTAGSATALSNGTQTDGQTSVTGATSATLALTNIQTGFDLSQGTFSCVVTNNYGSTATNPVSQPVASAGTPPSAATPTGTVGTASSTTVAANGTIILASAISGTTPISYQWNFNGTAISGSSGTTSISPVTLTLSGIQASQAGSYALEVSNSADPAGVTSSATNVTVVSEPSQGSQGFSPQVSAGSSATFSVAAVGGSPTYQWYLNGSALSNGGSIAGATSSSISISDAQGANQGQYTVVVSGDSGSITESGYTLTVISSTLGLASSSPQLPAVGATNVPYDAPLFLSFNNSPLSLGSSGQVRLYNSANTLIATIDLSTLNGPNRNATTVGQNWGSAGLVGSQSLQGTSGWFYYPVLINHDYPNRLQVQFPNGTLQPNTSYYVQVDAGVVSDSTGSFAGITDNSWSFTTKAALTAPTSRSHLVVAADNSGDFATVQGALDLLYGNGNTSTVTQLQASAPRVTIFIKNGTYEQNVFVRGLYNVTFKGQSMGGAIIEYGTNPGETGTIVAGNNQNANFTPGGGYVRGVFEIYDTSGSAAAANLETENIVLENLSILNLTPKGLGNNTSGAQAEALISSANDTIINNVTLTSYQDTLQTNGATYISDSHISGDVDFNWGDGPSFYYNTYLVERTSGGYFVQARNGTNTALTDHGYIFNNCHLSGASGVSGVYLARDGGANPYDEVMYLNCDITDGSAPLTTVGFNNEGASPTNFNWAWYNLTNTAGGAYNTLAFLTEPGAISSSNTAEISNYETPSYVLGGWSPALAPTLLTQPATTTSVAAAGSFTLTVSAEAVPEPSYQWSLNGSALTDGTLGDGAVISGSATGTLTVTNATGAEAGTYTAVASNGVSPNATSAGATVNVTGASAPVAIVTQPTSQDVASGATLTLTVAASGDPAPSYRWYFNGAALSDGGQISGSTSSTLTITGATYAANQGLYLVSVVNGTSGTNSNTVTVVVGGAASIYGEPAASVTAFAGGTARFSASAAGSSDVYQWNFDGTAIAGATASTYVLNDVQAGNAGSYTLTVSNAFGSAVTSTASVLTVDAPVSITAQPASQSVASGATVTLTVTASGSPAPTYRWYFNGAALTDGGQISGSTSSTLTITGATYASNQGIYLVSVVNGVSGANSNTATVVVGGAASIYAEPAPSVTVLANGTARFSASASGTALQYQWNFDGTAIAGATASTYVLSNAQAGNAGNYTLTVSNVFGGPVTSTASVLTVDTPVAITAQPSSQDVATGTTLTLTVAASGSPAPSYRWYFNGAALSDGGQISGSTSSTLTITGATYASNQGLYLVSVVNGVSGANSNTATVVVGGAASIYAQPASSVTVLANGTATFSASAAGTALQYQWNFDGTAIAGANAATYVLSNVQSGNAGSYTLTVSNAFGSAVTSTASVLTVNTPVAITTQPSSQDVASGTTLTLTVAASGSPAPSYRWYFKGTALTDGGQISGSTSSTLTITGATYAANQGVYLVSVVNGVSGANSNPATVLVGGAVTIYNEPAANVKAFVGTTVTLSAGVGGTTPVYQWNFDGSAIGGATATTYVLSDVQAGSSGSYTLTVSNGFGSAVTSTPSVLTVGSTASITAQPQVQPTSDSGSTVTLTVAASGTPAPTYQWSVNGTAIAGASSSTYAIVYATQSESGSYTVAVSTGFGATQTSSAANVDVIAPVVSWTNAAVTATQGITTNFTIEAGGSRSILVAGLGPILFGSDLPTPTVTLYDSTHTVILTATGMSTFSGTYLTSVVSAANVDAGIPITTSSADSVFLVTLAPGSYQAVLTGGGNSGNAELAVYDLSTAAFMDTQTTTQGPVAPSALMIEKFLVAGVSTDNVLVAALGPGLSVGSPLADPELTVMDQNQNVQGTDTGSASAPVVTAEANDLSYTMNAGDSGLILGLAPGVYEAVSTSASGSNSGTSEIDVLQNP